MLEGVEIKLKISKGGKRVGVKRKKVVKEEELVSFFGYDYKIKC